MSMVRQLVLTFMHDFRVRNKSLKRSCYICYLYVIYILLYTVCVYVCASFFLNPGPDFSAFFLVFI